MHWSRFAFLVGVMLVIGALAGGSWRSVAQAQSAPAVQVTDSSAESKFPSGMQFKLKLNGAAAVKEITVRVSVMGARVQQYGTMPLPQSGSNEPQLLFRTDTGDRYIPPGSLVTYFFEVRDMAGNITTTKPKQFIYDDPRFTWQELKKGNTTIRFYGPVQRRAETVADAIQITIDKIGKGLFGLTDAQISPVRITMYNSWHDELSALPFESNAKNRELDVEGVTFSQFKMILLHADVPNVRGVASHEMTHFLLGDALGQLVGLVPAWMNEGLAEYGNLEPGQQYEQFLALAIARGTLKPLTSLTVMPGVALDAITVYGQGHSVMDYLISTYGTDKFRLMLQTIRQGQSIDTSLRAAYGVDRFGLDQQWRAQIGAPALQTDARSGALPPSAPRPTVEPFQLPNPSSPSTTAPSSPPAGTPASTPPAVPTASDEAPRREGGGACMRADGPVTLDLGMWLGLGGALAFVAVKRKRF
ncbi:MAG: hypothetical protein EXR67_00310 [Dehalococcoidia bacterium]|nr:hypothetical protein [Dehalococcoidia bacterium]